MVESRGLQWFLKGATALTLSFIYLPLFVICLYAFNERRTNNWPISGLSLQWFEKAVNNPGVRAALWTSIKAGLGATAVAVLLGTLAAIAVSRYRFFGRESISFLVILPLALPGIVTGMALNTTFRTLGVDLGLFTVIVGHATFCIVVVYNNAVARMRRVSGSLDEASMDLGADSWQTFRYRDSAADLDGDRRWLAARVRALVRRGDRDHVHDQRAGDASDLDTREPLAAEPVADRQRRCRLRDSAVDHPRLDRAAARL